MLKLVAKPRKETGKKVRALRKEGKIPAVLYGPKIENLNLEIDQKEFEKILERAGESSLISLEVGKKKYLVLIHDVQRDPIKGKPIHVDFYQPILEEKIVVKVPLVFEGEAPAVKLGGTLVKMIDEIEVKALPESLPKEIRVSLEKLKSFEDQILVSDLKLPKGVEVMRSKNDVIAKVLPVEKTEEKKEETKEENKQ